MLEKLTDEQIESRLDMVELMIASERDTETLKRLNHMFEKMIDEQIRRANKGRFAAT
jgi:hypothetical protein